MKKIFFILFITLSFQNVFACDMCGCSSSNYFMGPFPQFNKYFLGTRYSFRKFNTVLKSDNNQFSNDFYQTVELWGGMRISKRWQLFIFAPFNFNRSITDDGCKQNKGIGDITLIGNYNLLNRLTLRKDSETVYQQLWVGGGLKIPTGKFTVDTSEIVSSANNQPGTGSLDFLLSVTYSLQVKNWGMNSNVNYKFNQSADNFKFGNRFYATAFVFRSIHFSKITLSPNIGLLYENLNRNENHNEKIEDTGGNVLLSALGIETRFNRIGIGFNAQLPLIQNLSNAQTNTILRGMFHLSYMF